MHYYYKDKTHLFEAVFARRAGITSGQRMAALERYEKESSDNPSVEGTLRAFLDTDLDLYCGCGGDWITADLTYRFAVTDDLALTATVANTFDHDPPRAQEELGYDPWMGNPLGRTFEIGMKKSV